MSGPLRGLVYDVQRFSVHDGPGIRTTVFFKGCPFRCAWCQNPESLQPEVELSVDLARCHGLGECRATCAALADGPARLDRRACDGCGRCVPACPYGALRVVGRSVGVDELVAEVSRDTPFYAASGGGVTLSGGEPTLQLPFAVAFARACHAAGLTVGLQTCGAFRWIDFAPHLGAFDFVHFDLKLVDGARHRTHTGADPRVVLDNARALVAAGACVTFRTPVVPGLNDGEDDLRALAEALRALGTPRLTLLAYHAMGEAKLPRIGMPLAPLTIAPARTAGSVERAQRLLTAAGIEVTT